MVANCLSFHDATNRDEWLPCLILLSTFSICGTLINGFVLFVFLRIKTVVSNANRFLIVLTIGQIILAAVIGPFHIAQLVKTTDSGNCYMDPYKDYVEALALVSAVSNGVVSYDRYLHVSLAHSYKQKMSGVFLYALIGCPWAIMSVYIITLIASRLLSYVVLITIVIILAFTLLFNYIRLIKRLYAQQNNSNVAMQTRIYRKKRNDRAALLCISIIMVEFVCSSAGLFTLICAFGSSAHGGDWDFWEVRNALVREVAFILFMMSGCINPFFYLYNHRPFKQFVTIFFNRGKVSQAIEDFYEERAERKRMQQLAEVALPDELPAEMRVVIEEINGVTQVKYVEEKPLATLPIVEGELKIIAPANATGQK